MGAGRFAPRARPPRLAPGVSRIAKESFSPFTIAGNFLPRQVHSLCNCVLWRGASFSDASTAGAAHLPDYCDRKSWGAMPEEITEREAALMARVAQLEAAVSQRSRPAGGNAIEQLWRYFSAFVPSWIIVAGLAVFLGFQAWEYYNQGPLLAADTQLKAAQAAIADAKSRAANTDVDGVKMQIATVRADVAKKQNEAARAKVEADAQNAKLGDETTRLQQIRAELDKKQQDARRSKLEADTQNALLDGETTRLQQVRAELQKKQAEAGKAKNAADAAGESAGVGTLADKEAYLKLLNTEADAADSRMQASILNFTSTVEAVCAGNQFAEVMGCPQGYVDAARRLAARQSAPSVRPTSPPRSSQDNSAPSVAYRTPALFDCAKASMGADFVICASPELLDREARLEDAYNAARSARGNAVRSEQIDWIKTYWQPCGLPKRGQPPPDQIKAAKGCVKAAMDARISQLQAQN
jgi:hypothetical protein